MQVTNPLKGDTDDEGLSDGDEIKLGTSPLVQDTDGDSILDCDEKIMQDYVYETSKDDLYIEEVKVTLNATGNVEETTWIEGMRGMDPICEGVIGIVDEPFSIETESDFDTATISFKMNMDGLGNKSVEDYIILWYDEENCTFVEMDTKYDAVNGIISTETTHFSRYMVVDKAEWFEAWNMQLDYSNTENEKSTYTVLAVDCSGSMDTYDPITSYFDTSNMQQTNDCDRYDAIRHFIYAMEEGDKTAIITFESFAEVQCELTDSKSTLLKEAAKFYNSGGTDFNAALQESLNVLNNCSDEAVKKIVLLSDGNATADEAILADIVDAKIKVYTIGLGNSSYDAELQRIADVTGGEFFKAYKSGELEGIYEDISMGIDTTDTDGDKLYDVYEVVGIRLQNGTTIFTDPTDPDSDDDGLPDGEEINPEIIHNEVYYPTGVSLEKDYFIMVSDPKEEDGDYDGYLDADELAGVLKDDGTRYEPSNPLISNVKKVEISNDYIKIDTPEDVDHWNYYYGGNQMWFYDVNHPDRSDLDSLQLEKGGCGVIASCDNLLYLQKYMGWNLTTVNTSGDMIAFDEYDAFVRDYAETNQMPSRVNEWCVNGVQAMTMGQYGKDTVLYKEIGKTGYDFSMWITGGDGTFGIWADWLVKELNEHLSNSGNDIDSEYVKYNTLSYEPTEIANKIAASLEKDIPVIFATNLDSKVLYHGVNVNLSDALGAHFVTITGIQMDTITGENTLIISTWSFEATTSLNDFYMQNTDGSRTVIFE